MSTSDYLESSAIKDGFGMIIFKTWAQYLGYIQNYMIDHSDCIWRGQKVDHWKLESSLQRLLNKNEFEDDILGQISFSEWVLDEFKLASRGRRGSSPVKLETENEWWALGQHFGLATPLLDWTKSPFVAAYFAFFQNDNETTEQSEYRAVYALHKTSVETRVNEKVSTKKAQNFIKLQKIEAGEIEASKTDIRFLSMNVPREIHFIYPQSDENPRLVNQAGLFTKCPIGYTIEEWVKENFKGHTDSYILMKLLIPSSERITALKSLNRMNINHLTLFPDLSGASKYCNLQAEIDNY
jgi:FRG domain